MAAAKKGKKKSSPKKSSKSKKKSNGMNFFTKFILAILLIAILFIAVFYIVNNFKVNDFKRTNNTKTEVVVNNNKANDKKEENKAKYNEENNSKQTTSNSKKDKTTSLKEEFKELKTLTGSWHSSEQGAFLSIDEYGYRIDFSNVDASRPITGNYRIENNLIIFTSDGSECNNEEGTYRINFYKKNISLTCKKDDCLNRRNILEADWEWLEY